MPEILKYVAWGITTLIPVVGQYFSKFTEDDPDHPHGYRLTRAGKLALTLTLVGIIISFGLTIASDLQDAKNRQALDNQNAQIKQELDQSVVYGSQLTDLDKTLSMQLASLQATLAEVEQALKVAKTDPTRGQDQLQQAVQRQMKIPLFSQVRPVVPPVVAAYRAKLMSRENSR